MPYCFFLKCIERHLLTLESWENSSYFINHYQLYIKSLEFDFLVHSFVSLYKHKEFINSDIVQKHQ